jgi:hypothetical protein
MTDAAADNDAAQPEAAPPAISRALRYLMQGAFVVTLVATLFGLLVEMGDATALVSVLVIMTGVLVLVEVLPRVAEFAIGPVRGKLVQIERGQQRLRSDVEAIRTALTGIVTTFEIDYLRRLDRDEPWMCRYDPDTYYRLKRLDDMGFVLPTEVDGNRRLIRIQEHFGDESIPVDHRTWFNMRDYVEITKTGRDYVKLYDAVSNGA